MKKLLLSALMCLMALSMTAQNTLRLVTDRGKGETLSPIPQGYVDLGLPSGTLWKEENETGGLYTYDQALAKFGNDLPTKDQYEELLSSCRWTWIENGYLGEGPNGETITLLAAGYRDCGDSVSSVNDICSTGIYWSSTPDKSKYAWGLYLDSFGVGIFYGNRCNAQSVRLVR